MSHFAGLALLADYAAMPTSPKPVAPKDEDAKVSHKDEQPRDRAETQSGDAPVEIGGRGGPEPTRFGDWEKNGRCIDF
jgi:hypothetical protein